MLCSHYIIPSTLDEALQSLAEQSANGGARIVAGGTDILVEIEHGLTSTPALIDLSRLPGLDQITQSDGRIHIGPMVTHNQAVANLPDPATCLAVAAGKLGSGRAADPQSWHHRRESGDLLACQ